MKRKGKFIPDWSEEAPEKGSYRAVFKMGSPDRFKHPGDAWYAMLKEALGMNDSDFKEKKYEGRDPIPVSVETGLSQEQVDWFVRLVGRENVVLDLFDRVKYSHGQTIEEAMELRRGNIPHVAWAVIHPENKGEVLEIVSYCHDQKIPIYAYGGGSSVTLGVKPVRGGIMLAMATHMNRVLEVNEQNQTARVQPGCMGPVYEDILNHSAHRFGTRRNYTGGHFPQSFEMSTVGGWVAALGSGQASTCYGDACDLVLSQEYVTPTGTFKTLDYPSAATGPKVNDMMKGSEGAFGVLVEVTMKIFRYMPGNRRRFSYMFPNWDAAVNAVREISQGEFGKPAVFRISDAEETEVGLKLYHFSGSMLDRAATLLKYKPMKRCLCMGTVEGERGFVRNVNRKIFRICLRNGALPLGVVPVKRWEKTRYSEPYLRDDLQDYGILIDTLETSIGWDQFQPLHEAVRNVIKSRPRTICMAHASHIYPQGANLYFIFILKMEDVEEYRQFRAGILDTILKNGGSMSHHHGMGKMIAPWLERHLGSVQMEVLRALKRHFDPNNIMNPGGQLGLD